MGQLLIDCIEDVIVPGGIKCYEREWIEVFSDEFTESPVTSGYYNLKVGTRSQNGVNEGQWATGGNNIEIIDD